MEKDYIEFLALSNLTTYHYKILLLLNVKPQNQAQLAETLNIKKQNVYKHVKELQEMNLVKVDRIEGRNKFYRVEKDLQKIHEIIPGQTKII